MDDFSVRVRQASTAFRDRLEIVDRKYENCSFYFFHSTIFTLSNNLGCLWLRLGLLW